MGGSGGYRSPGELCTLRDYVFLVSFGCGEKGHCFDRGRAIILDKGAYFRQGVNLGFVRVNDVSRIFVPEFVYHLSTTNLLRSGGIDHLYVPQEYVGHRPYSPMPYGCGSAFVLYLFVIAEGNFGNKFPLTGKPFRHFARLREGSPARNTMCEAALLRIARQRFPSRDV